MLVAKALGHKTHVASPYLEEVWKMGAPIPHYTTDPAAALQAMKDVGIRYWSLLSYDDKTLIDVLDRPCIHTGIILLETHKLDTLELACAFAAYAFSELKLKEGTE